MFRLPGGNCQPVRQLPAAVRMSGGGSTTGRAGSSAGPVLQILHPYVPRRYPYRAPGRVAVAVAVPAGDAGCLGPRFQSRMFW